MRTKQAFEECDFDQATEIDGGEDSGVTVNGELGETRYFICEVFNHCRKG